MTPAGFELTLRETRFVIHFGNFAEHFFLVFGKFMNQSSKAELSFNFNPLNASDALIFLYF